MKSYSLGILLVVVVAIAVVGAGIYIYTGSLSKKESVLESGHKKVNKNKNGKKVFSMGSIRINVNSPFNNL